MNPLNPFKLRHHLDNIIAGNELKELQDIYLGDKYVIMPIRREKIIGGSDVIYYEITVKEDICDNITDYSIEVTLKTYGHAHNDVLKSKIFAIKYCWIETLLEKTDNVTVKDIMKNIDLCQNITGKCRKLFSDVKTVDAKWGPVTIKKHNRGHVGEQYKEVRKYDKKELHVLFCDKFNITAELFNSGLRMRIKKITQIYDIKPME